MPVELTTNGRNLSVKNYIKQKVRSLEKEFLIPLTFDENERIHSCETHDEVDDVARKIMWTHWDKE